MGVYSIDSIARYIKFYEIIKKRNAKCPFAIFNTDKHNKAGTHWCFLDIYPPPPKKKKKLFDSLGLIGFKYFAVDNDESITEKMLYNFSSCKVKEEKLTLCSLKFSAINWEKLKPSEKEKLTDTAQNFFHILTEFAKLKKEMTLIIVEHPIQQITASTCGIFQIYFYKNLFDPDEKSIIVKNEFLTKKTIDLMNKIFSTNTETNEKEMQNFKKEYNL